MVAGPATAEVVNCGAVLGPGGSFKLDRNLECDTAPALIVVGPTQLNLKGFTVTCVRASEDDPLTNGIEVTGQNAKLQNGLVTGCHDGVVVAGDGHHKLLDVTAEVNEGAGFLVESSENQFVRNTAKENGTPMNEDVGFRINGSMNEFVGNVASSNTEDGYRMTGDSNRFVNNIAEDNHQHGFRIQPGSDNELTNNSSAKNEDDGFRIRASDGSADGNRLHNNEARGNGESGIRFRDDSNDNNVTNNVTESNTEYGIRLGDETDGNEVFRNVARDNGAYDLGDDHGDCDSNVWSKNVFETADPDCID